MQSNKFKIIVKDFFINKGFKYIYKKRRFIKEFEDLFIKIELQKSLYSNAYYINYYIYCKELHTYNEVVELSFGDLFGRFCPIVNDKKVSIFDLDILDDNTLIDALYESTKEILNVLENDGIKGYLKFLPQSIHTATRYSSEYLNDLISKI